MPKNTSLIAAATAVQRAATRRVNVVLRDEFGPHRGRPFLPAPAAIFAGDDRDELGRRISARAQLAYEVA